jgi:hypothetical protein
MPHDAHDPYASPFVNYRENMIRLDVLKFGVEQRIGASVAASLTARGHRDPLTDSFVQRIEGSLLAEELPPVTMDDVQHFTVPRFATVWDHWKAAHWDRWYVWTLRDLGWIKPPRFVDEPHTHRTTVNVRTRWTYPRATTVLPANQWGHVVLKSQAQWTANEVRHW